MFRWALIATLLYSDNYKTIEVLYINNLHVVNFKNHDDKTINFLPKLNAICGNNGSGKTNLLDAINYLCITKSYFNIIDSQNIQEGENYFTIEGEFIKNTKKEKVFCGFREGGKKILKKNNIPYEKNNEHLGLLPLIINAPADSAIITGGSPERRKFIDSTLSQTEKFNWLNMTVNGKLDIAKSTYVTGGMVHEALQDFSRKFNLMINYGHVSVINRKKFQVKAAAGDKNFMYDNATKKWRAETGGR